MQFTSSFQKNNAALNKKINDIMDKFNEKWKRESDDAGPHFPEFFVQVSSEKMTGIQFSSSQSEEDEEKKKKRTKEQKKLGDDVHRECVLLDYQKGHYQRIKDILSKLRFAIDLSHPGAGKTYIACEYVREMKFEHVYVFCPANLTAKWTKISKGFNMGFNVFSYSKMIGKRGDNWTPHGLLDKNN